MEEKKYGNALWFTVMVPKYKNQNASSFNLILKLSTHDSYSL